MTSIVMTVKKRGFRWYQVEKATGLTWTRPGKRPGTRYFRDADGEEWFGFLGCDTPGKPGYRQLMIAPNVPL